MTVKRQRFLPYHFAARALELHVTAVRSGEDPVDVDAVLDADRRLLDLRDYGGDTRPVELQLEVRGAASTWAAAIPEPERDAPPVRLALLAQDEGGWYRTVGDADLAPGRDRDVYRGTLTLMPADSTGLVTVEALALRTADAATPDPRFAARAGMRVGSTHPLAVRFADPARTPGGNLEIKWEVFADSAHAMRRAHPDRVYYLEATLDPPVLWLNKGVPDLDAVLESKGTRGFKTAIRELVFRTIALPVWMGLAQDVLFAVTLDEDDQPTVPGGWRQGLLARLAPRLEPGVPRDVAYTRTLERLWATREGHEPAGALVERLVAVLQDEIELDATVRRALRELAR